MRSALSARFALDAGRADRPAAGNRQRDVVDAVVGEELGAGVKLVAVPALVLQHAELRKPLGDEEEIADRAGAREGARHVRGPCDLDGRAAAGLDRLRQRHRHHRLDRPALSSSGAMKRFAAVRSTPPIW